MTSVKQIVANKENAKRSTGPKTQRGRAKSALNSLKHGLLSREALLPQEDFELYENLRTAVVTHLNPSGPIEMILIDEVVANLWRLRRAYRIESGFFSTELDELQLFSTEESNESIINKLSPDDSQKLFDAIKTLDDILGDSHLPDMECSLSPSRPQELPATITPPASSFKNAFVRITINEDYLTRLTRYIASIERNIYRALHELQRLQSSRGIDNPLSAVIDIV